MCAAVLPLPVSYLVEVWRAVMSVVLAGLVLAVMAVVAAAAQPLQLVVGLLVRLTVVCVWGQAGLLRGWALRLSLDTTCTHTHKHTHTHTQTRTHTYPHTHIHSAQTRT